MSNPYFPLDKAVKTCPECGQEKEASCFKFKPGGKVHKKCTDCVTKLKKKWRKPVRDTYDWTNPIFCKRMHDQHEKMLNSKFKITTSEESHMHNEQGACCAICGVKTQLLVDHCHETGKVRGLLCRGCNGGIGFFRENPSAMRKAAEYIEYFKSNPGPIDRLRERKLVVA